VESFHKNVDKVVELGDIIVVTDKLNLTFFNSHWSGEEFIIPKTERQVIAQIYKDLETRQIHFLVGARRLGKSTSLKQTLIYLVNTLRITPKQILFYEFSSGQTSDFMWEVFEYFQTQIADFNQKIYILLDEVQYIPNFENVLKLWYDKLPNLKIIATGSLSLGYKRKMSESLAGRIIVTHFYPLNFEEFLNLSNHSLQSSFKELKVSTDKFRIVNLTQKLNPVFRDFLKNGRYPQIILENLEPKSYLESILNQSINIDSTIFFNIFKPNSLRNLFDYILKNNGFEVNLSSLSQYSGLDRETTKNYLNCLELLGLIYVLNKTNQRIQDSANNFKVYTSSTWSLNMSEKNLDNYGQIAESYYLERSLQQGEQLYFYRNRNKEVDFINLKKGLAAEIKYRLKVEPSDIKGLSLLSRKIKLKPKLVSMFSEDLGLENEILMMV